MHVTEIKLLFSVILGYKITTSLICIKQLYFFFLKIKNHSALLYTLHLYISKNTWILLKWLVMSQKNTNVTFWNRLLHVNYYIELVRQHIIWLKMVHKGFLKCKNHSIYRACIKIKNYIPTYHNRIHISK